MRGIDGLQQHLQHDRVAHGLATHHRAFDLGAVLVAILHSVAQEVAD
jgi:hypothetical protein|eukprot:COSAG06_NODE_251_length_19092_cov_52.770126_5_plen_47_part_00